MTITFSKKGNKHLHADTFGRSKILGKTDLLQLPSIVERSEYVKTAELSKVRKDSIIKFLYFKATLHGKDVFLNVAEERPRSGRQTSYYLYSVTDKIK